MVCVNINDPEFKKILEKSKNPLLAEIEYMEKYGLINAKPSQPTQIKEGVEELFNSNPELANQVYESLGFNTTKDIKETWINYISKKDNITRKEVLQRLDIYNPKMITVYRGEGSTVNLENSNLPDYIKRSKGRWFTKDKTVAEQYAEMQKGKLFAVQLPEELFNNISKALNLQDTNGMEALLPQELVDEKIEITTPTAQQKQEALKLYSEYLDSIFPESKVKDIVYHFSNTKIEIPDKNKFSLSANINRRKGFFGISKNINPRNNFANVEGTIPHAMLFNMKNPDFGDFSIIPPVVAKDETKDSAIIKQRGNINYYSVFEPEQIHILGTQEDIEGFKSFVKGEIVSTSTQEITSVPLSSKELLNEIETDETKKEDQCELNLNYDDFDLPF
jgi:hypothetical protein